MFFGAGPHISVFDNGKGSNLVFGAAYAKELYSLKAEPKKELQQDNAVAYVHANAKLTDKFSVGQDITFQEKLGKDFFNFDKYLISSETFAKVDITPNVAAKFAYEAVFTKLPKVTFDKIDSNMKTGIEIKL